MPKGQIEKIELISKFLDKAKVINCATGWKDLGAFEDFLVTRLTK